LGTNPAAVAPGNVDGAAMAINLNQTGKLRGRVPVSRLIAAAISFSQEKNFDQSLFHPENYRRYQLPFVIKQYCHSKRSQHIFTHS
jgi:hypothetical protein